MTIANQFAPNDWRLLARLPIEIGAAASVADDRGASGTTRELLTAISTLLSGAMLLRHNELVQAVFEEYKLDGRGEAELLELSQNPPTDLVPSTLAHAAAAAKVLAARNNSDEATEFKLWLRGLAAEIVVSSASGGFLGIGGTRVTDDELSFLDHLTSALALEPPRPE